jgi:hypothetical protein
MGKVDSRNNAYVFENLMKMYYEMIDMYPDHAEELIAEMGAISNTAKVVKGEYNAVINPYLLKRKQMFEDELKSIVNNDPKLKGKYNHIWEGIKELQDELSKFGNIKAGYTISYRGLNVNLFNSATKLYTLAQVLKNRNYTKLTDSLKTFIDTQIDEAFDNSKNRFGKEKTKHGYDETSEMKSCNITYLIKLNLGNDKRICKTTIGDKTEKKLQKIYSNTTILRDKEKVKQLFLRRFKFGI